MHRGVRGVVLGVDSPPTRSSTRDLPQGLRPTGRTRPARRRGGEPSAAAHRGADPALLGAGPHLRGQRRGPPCRRRRRHRGRQRVRLLRRTALRQRPAALRSPAHRLREGRRPPVPDHAGASSRAAVRLGLPRAARRGRGREAARDHAQVRDRVDGRRGVQRRVPYLRARLHQGLGGLRPPPGSVGRFRERLQDPRPGLHGVRDVGLQVLVGQGVGLRGIPGPGLLHAVRDAA